MGNLFKSKYSQGHVEMIISFAIFIGFIGVLLFLLNPSQSSQITYTIVDITEQVLLEEWTIDYTTVSLAIKPGTYISKNCIAVDNIFGDLGYDGVLVKNTKGDIKDSRIGNKIRIDYDGEQFFQLYLSDYFSLTANEPASDCQDDLILNVDYTFGSSLNKKAILFENIEGTESSYNSDYENLKTDLNLNNDFMFFVYTDRGTMLVNASTFVPRYVEIVARDIPVVAIDENAVQKNLILNLRAW